MGYSQQHKAETRAKLLKLASVALRKHGPDKLGAVELMKTAGLTHGGFYAHFESREALLLEALKTVFEEARARYQEYGGRLPPREALSSLIGDYLSATHRDRLSLCPIVTMNSDLPRQSSLFRATYRAGVLSLVGILAGWIKAAGLPAAEVTSASLLAEMAGAIALSRAITDKNVSDLLLERTRGRIRAELSLGAFA
jgi:TetR/AcrR family transcriptional regulator, transcriptional repressor for nem operon